MKSVMIGVIFGMSLGYAQDDPFEDATFPGRGQLDPFDSTRTAEVESNKIIHIQVEYIELSQMDMTELTYGPKKSANDAGLRDKIQKMLDEGKASMLETQMIVSRSGEKVTSESVQEYIFATEYEPAEITNTSLKKEEAEGPRALAPEPTAFETRNVGVTMELEPTLGEDGKTIDIRLAPEIVWHVENVNWTTWKDKNSDAGVKMPVFYSMRINTGITALDGLYHHACTMTPRDEKGNPDPSRKVMVMVKAEVHKAGR